MAKNSVLSRWKSRLATRRALLAKAEADVRYAAKHAGNARGRVLLEQAVAKRKLRREQVAFAERVVARHEGAREISPNGVAFIAGFEEFSSKAYWLGDGVWTIGYGSTAGVKEGDRITRTAALARLKRELAGRYQPPVLALADQLELKLRQSELDALVSFVYNLGPGVLAAGTTMGDALRSRNRRRIAAAFLIYDKARINGVVTRMPGLTRRRKAERNLFLKES